MPTIDIIIRNKTASAVNPPCIVCGNSDYNVKFNFDEEWQAHNNKIGVFAYNRDGEWQSEKVLFEGDTCPVPALHGVRSVWIGVTAGDVRTSTPADVPCRMGATDFSDTTEKPPEDIWGQILDKLDSIGAGSGTDISLGVTATVGQAIKVKAVDADGKPTAWEAVDMATGDAEVWELINTLTITEENAVAMFAIDKDSNGKPFSLKKATMKSLLTNTKNVPLKGWLCFNGRGVYNSGVHGFVTQNYLSYTMANYGVEWGIEVVPKVSYEYKGVSKEFSSTTQNDIHEIEVSRYQNNETLVYGTIELWGVRK